MKNNPYLSVVAKVADYDEDLTSDAGKTNE